MELGKRWSNAAIWKWCELNKGSDGLENRINDNAVSKHELFPVKAPLQVMEHCIGDFLDQCDSDGDHAIDLEVCIFSIKIVGMSY